MILARTVASDLRSPQDGGVRPAGPLLPFGCEGPRREVPEPKGSRPSPSSERVRSKAALEAGINVLANAPTPEAPSMVKAIDLLIQKVRKGEEIAPWN